MEIRRYLEVVSRHKWVVAITLAVTLAVVALVTYLMPPTYSATSVIRIADEQANSNNYFNPIYADRIINTYIQLVQTRPMMESVIGQFGLATTPKELSKRIKVEGLANTQLLRVTAQSRDPREAANISNALVKQLVDQTRDGSGSDGKSAKDILQEQVANAQATLQNDNARLQGMLNQNNDPSQAQAVQALRTQIDVEQQSYARLLQDYEQTRVADALRANSLAVVEPAVAPPEPSSPRPLLNLALGLLLGLIGGLGLAFLFDNLDTAIHYRDELETVARVPMLGSIPHFTVPRGLRSSPFLLAEDMQSPAGEAFRILRTNVMSPASGTPPSKLLVTSAEPAAGKSTVSANLAVVMAQAGQRVILVDADFRHPGLDRAFGVSNAVGLSSVLQGTHALNEALQQTRVEGLSVLPSGPSVASPAELLGSPAMKRVMDELATRADMVMVDAPPILPVADTVVMASMVDTTLLVAARDQVTAKNVRRALAQLDKVGATTLGIVFNRAQVEDGGHYYYPRFASRNASRSSRPATLARRLGWVLLAILLLAVISATLALPRIGAMPPGILPAGIVRGAASPGQLPEGGGGANDPAASSQKPAAGQIGTPAPTPAPGGGPGALALPGVTLPSIELTSTESADAIAQKTGAVEAGLRSGVFAVKADNGRGGAAATTLRFDLGDGGRAPSLYKVTTYSGTQSGVAGEYVTIGDRSWQRQQDGPWTAVTNPQSVKQQVEAFLPRADSAGQSTVDRQDAVYVLRWDDAERQAQVTLEVDAATHVPRRAQLSEKSTGVVTTVTYTDWNVPVTITMPPKS